MFDDINMSLATSARQVAEISRRMDEKNQQEAAHRAKLEAGAEADIAQKNCFKVSLKLCASKMGCFLKSIKSSKQRMIPR